MLQRKEDIAPTWYMLDNILLSNSRKAPKDNVKTYSAIFYTCMACVWTISRTSISHFCFRVLTKTSCSDSQRTGKRVSRTKQIGLRAAVHICHWWQNRWVQVVLESLGFLTRGFSAVSLAAQTLTFIYYCRWQDDESTSAKRRQFSQVNIFHTINSRYSFLFFFFFLVATQAEWQFRLTSTFASLLRE